jgi:hypothetical protein
VRCLLFVALLLLTGCAHYKEWWDYPTPRERFVIDCMNTLGYNVYFIGSNGPEPVYVGCEGLWSQKVYNKRRKRFERTWDQHMDGKR